MNKFLKFFPLIILLVTGGCSFPGEWKFVLPFFASPTTTAQAILSATPTVSPSVTIRPTETLFPLSSDCDSAAAGIPLDITIPDGTRLQPDSPFTKTWQIVNAGACTWTSQYAIIWYYGDELSSSRVRYLREEVKPGETLQISMDMTAPSKPGIYQSYWKLRNVQGNLFGIGPSGQSPLWVRIEVINLQTITPTPTLTPTPQTSIQVRKQGLLFLEEALNLDSGEIGSDSTEIDLTIEQNTEDDLVLVPQNDASFILFGQKMPELIDCSKLTPVSEPLLLQQFIENNSGYICFVSNRQVPGYLYIHHINLEEKTISYEFLTWSIP